LMMWFWTSTSSVIICWPGAFYRSEGKSDRVLKRVGEPLDG
jgi:hypothetical protein